LIDGGNSYYVDDIPRAKELAPRGIHYLGVGTSGGVWDLERGYCMMIGGETDVVQRLDPIFGRLAPGTLRALQLARRGRFQNKLLSAMPLPVRRASREAVEVRRRR
jgi:6-phosphogluconate dehydrogenase (decarboxylating)